MRSVRFALILIPTLSLMPGQQGFLMAQTREEAFDTLDRLEVAATQGAQSPVASFTPPRWVPRVSSSVQALPGGEKLGGVRVFVPVMQTPDSLVFVEVRGQFGERGSRQGTLGLGYRRILLDQTMAVGINAFVDAMTSTNDRTYTQAGLGVELTTERFDLFGNFYEAFGSQGQVGTAPGGPALGLNGTQIVRRTGSLTILEDALSGFDVGGSLKFPFSDDVLMRVNGSYYEFGSGASRRDGFSVGLGFDFDQPFGIDGARLSVGAERIDDSRTGNDFAGFLRIDIPLGNQPGRGASDRPLNAIERELTRGVNRRGWMVTDLQVTDNRATTQLTDVPSGQGLDAFFVAETRQGAGDCTLVANACTVADIAALAGAGDIIVLVDAGGAITSVVTANADRQQVIGGGASGNATVTLSDAASTLFTFAGLGTRPPIAGININGRTDVNIDGMTVGASGITGTGVNGQITINDVVVNGGTVNVSSTTGAQVEITNNTVDGGAGPGIVVTSSAAGGLILNLSGNAVSTTGAGPAVDVSGGASDQVIVSGFANNTVTGTGGVRFDNVTFDADGNPGNGITDVRGGTLNIGASGAPVTGDGLRLNNVLGSLSFATLNVTNDTGTGLFVRDDGGKGGTFSLGTAGGTITTTNGTAIDIDPVALNMTLDQVNASGGPFGVLLDTVTGTFNVTGGAITGTTTAGLSVINSDIDVNFGATITNSAGNSVNVANNSGGTVDVQGTITDTGLGIRIDGNTGGTVTLSASNVDLTGGGISITNNAGAVTSTAGSSITITNPTAGVNGITFNNNTGAVNFMGTVSVDMGANAEDRGVDFAGNNGSVNFTSLSITDVGAGANQVAFDLAGATLNDTVSVTGFTISTGVVSTSSVGVDLTGVQNDATVQLGSASGTITGVNRGVVIDNTAAVQFTFGDGENATDIGSEIDVAGAGAFTVDAAGGTLGASNFNFLDVMVGAGDTANMPASATAPVFVSTLGGVVAAGTNGLSSALATISVTDAEAQADTDQTFIFIGDATGSIDLSSGGADGFTLEDGQSILGFNSGTPITFGQIQPLNITGNLGTAGGTITANTVTASNTGAFTAVVTAGDGGNRISGFDIDTGTDQLGLSITATTAPTTVDNITFTASGTSPSAIQIQNSTQNVTFTDVDIDNGGSVLLNVNTGNVTFDAASTLNIASGPETGITITGQTGGAVTFNGDVTINTTGTASGVSITGSPGGTVSFNGGLDITTEAGTGFLANNLGTINVTGAGNAISTATGQVLNLSSVAIGVPGITFDTLTATGTVAVGQGISLFSVTGGSFDGGTVSIAGTAVGEGVRILSTSADTMFTAFDIDSTGGDGIELNGNSGEFTVTGLTDLDGTGGIGINIQNNPGAYTFGDVTIDNRGGVGIGIDAATGGQQTGVFGDVTVNNQLNLDTSAIEVENMGIAGSTLTMDSATISVGGTIARGLSFLNNDGATVSINGGAITDVGTSGLGVAVSNSAGSFTYAGTITNSFGNSVLVTNNEAGNTTTFSGTITDSGKGISLINNTGGVISFTGTLDLDTGTNTGFNASSGGTINVSGPGSSITTTTGRLVNLSSVTIGGSGVTFDTLTTTGSVLIGDAIALGSVSGGTFDGGTVTIASTAAGDGVRIASTSATINFTSLDITGPAGDGIELNGNTGGFTVTGTTSITNPGGSGVKISGTNTGPISFAGLDISLGNLGVGVDISGTQSGMITFNDLDIALGTDNSTAFSVNGAVLNADVTANDFDVTSTNPIDTIGIDLRGATGTGRVQLGDTVTGDTQGATIAGVATGVILDDASAISFTFGDGEGTDTNSSIAATTAIDFTDATGATGSYNFLDVTFPTAGSTANLTGPTFFVFDTANTSGAGTFANPGSVSEADASTANVLIMIDNIVNGASTAINYGANTFTLGDNQALISMVSGQTVDLSTLGLGAGGAPANILLTGLSGSAVTAPNDGSVDTVGPTLTSLNNTATVELQGSAALIDVMIENTGTGTGVQGIFSTSETVTIRNATINTTTDALQMVASAGVLDFDFSDLTLTGRFLTLNTGAATLRGRVTGTNTITNLNGNALNLEDLVVDAAGVSFANVTSVNGTNGIFISDTSGGKITVENATVTNASNGVRILDTSNNIDIGTGATGLVVNGGNNGVIISSVIGGTINIGTGATSGGLQIGATTAVNNVGMSLSGSSGTTINIGNLSTQSVIAAGASSAADAVVVSNSNATVTLTSLDINQAGTTGGAEGIFIGDTNTVGLVTINGTTTIDNVGGRGIAVQGANVDISGVTIGATSAPGVDGVLVVDAGNAITVSLDNITVADATDVGFEILGTGGGTTTLTSFLNNTVTNAGEAGVVFNTVTFDGDLGFAGNQNVDFGTLNVGTPTNRVSGKGVSFIDPTGRVAATAINIYNNANTGLEVNTKGAGTTFNLDNGGGTVDTTNGTALFLDPLTGNVTFGLVSSSGAGPNGGVFIEQFDAEGGANQTALEITTLNITGSSGAALQIENSTGTFNFGDTSITNGATTGGGVSITNAGADATTVNFTTDLDITTGSGAGFRVTGGNNTTVTVTGADNTITTTTGQAVLINGADIGAGDVTFRSVSANGALIGIELANTGTTGSFIVTGDTGSANNGSGGVLQNIAGDAISLTNTFAPSFDQLNIIDAARAADGVAGDDHAIDILNVTNFSFTNATINGFGNTIGSHDDQELIRINNLYGTSSITNVTFTDINEFAIRYQNSSNNGGARDVLTITDSTFGAHLSTNGESAILFETSGTADAGLVVTGNTVFTINGNGALGILANANIASGDTSLVVQNTNFNMSNSFSGTAIQAFNVNSGTLNVTLENNVVLGNSTSGVGFNLRVDNTGAASPTGTLNALIDNNTFEDVFADHILLDGRDGSVTLNATVTNNISINAPTDSAGAGGSGLRVNGNDNATVRLCATGNDFISEEGAFAGFGFTGDFTIAGNGASTVTIADVNAATFSANNSNDVVVLSGTVSFSTGTTCTLPF